MNNTFVLGGPYGRILGRSDNLQDLELLIASTSGNPHTPNRVEQTFAGPWRLIFRDRNGNDSLALYGPQETLNARQKCKPTKVTAATKIPSVELSETPIPETGPATTSTPTEPTGWTCEP